MADLDIQTIQVESYEATLVFSGRGIVNFFTSGDFKIGGSDVVAGENVPVAAVPELRLDVDTDVYATVLAGPPSTSYPLKVMIRPLPNTATLVVDCG